ncbi:MAG: radical SAM protein [Planctomycetaceae bacterium]|nr:radical SAM protein [Planctomycetaceae bacterium]
MSQVYSNAKIFHFHQKLSAMQAGRLTAPLHVRLKPTNRCNHRCNYCCYRSEALLLSELMRVQDEIPRDKMLEIAADLSGMGVRAVTFTGGGEPLVYPHIVEAIEQLTAGGVKVAMLTNGALLAGKAADLLARRAVWVRVSMDAADAGTYAASRGVGAGEFDRVCGNIADFCRIDGRTCTIGLNLIVTSENNRQVLDFLRMAKGLGVEHVKVSCAVISTQPHENAHYQEPFFESVKAQIALGQAELAGDGFEVIDKFHRPDSRQESFARSYTSCPFAQCLTVIAADLNLYTCQDKAYSAAGLLGSIRDQSFRQAWSSEGLRRKLAAINPSVHCRHHCVAEGKNLALLDYFGADPEHLDFV